MGRIGAVLLSIFCGFFIRGAASVDPFYCAYKNDKIDPGLNTSTSEEAKPFRDLLERSNTGRAVFVKNGYQQCAPVDSKSVNNCYTLWQLDQTTQNYVVFKQGCWTDPQRNCQADKCEAPVSGDVAGNPDEIKFCCCHGNKCNDDKVRSKVNVDRSGVTGLSFNQIGQPKIGTQPNPKCAYKSRDVQAKGGKMTSDTEGLGTVMSDGKTAYCKHDDFCFSFFMMETNKTEISIIYQGCWDSADEKNTCNSSVCTPHEEVGNSKQNESSHFCCCRGDMCNNNISKDIIPYIRPISRSIQPVKIPLDPSYRERTILISLLSVFCVAMVILVLYLGYRCFFNPAHQSVNMNNNNNLDIPSSPAFGNG